MNVTNNNNKNYMIGENGEIKRIDLFNKVGMVFLTLLFIFIIFFTIINISDYRNKFIDINTSSKSEISYKIRNNVISEDKISLWIQNRPYNNKYDLIERNVLTMDEFERIENLIK